MARLVGDITPLLDRMRYPKKPYTLRKFGYHWVVWTRNFTAEVYFDDFPRAWDYLWWAVKWNR